MKKLFMQLYSASTEAEVDAVIEKHPKFEDSQNWRPLGDNLSNIGIIQNQQGQPAAALIEKVTNAIDAILMRRCLEEGLDPKGPKAPANMEEAIGRFFPRGLWGQRKLYDAQARDIQLLAHGPRGETSLVIYDAGEGQEPDRFPETFLSLVRGNKKDIRFVQGLYNMGGTGAIVFCGSKKYQLIGSRRYTGGENFGFTLIRRHPLVDAEESEKIAPWYEYFMPGGVIPQFAMKQPLDLGLRGRRFETGTVIKMYSYRLPPGIRANISQELYQSMSEFMIRPALPVWVADSAERYQRTNVLERTLVGLSRSIDQKASKVVEKRVSLEKETEFGKLPIECIVFRADAGDKEDYKKARESLKKQFFQNGGHVLFSVNGQVHGSWSMQFISRSLGMPLLKHHLLVLVDCTYLHTGFRNDLFMASRDRLAQSEQTVLLRETLRSALKGSELAQIHEQRKQALGVRGGSATKTISSYIGSLGRNSALKRMIAGHLDAGALDQNAGQGGSNTRRGGRGRKQGGAKGDGVGEEVGFKGRRFPTKFELDPPSGRIDSAPAARIPPGASRSVRFKTDVEDEYFTRSKDRGTLEVSLLGIHHGEGGKGKKRGVKKRGSSSPLEMSDVLHLEQVGPENGTIRLKMKPTEKVRVGDSIQMQATLSGQLTDITETFWVRIVERRPRAEKGPSDDLPGLPDPILIAREKSSGIDRTWEEAIAGGVEGVSEEMVVYPTMGEEKVEQIFINMDSTVFTKMRDEQKGQSEEGYEHLRTRYIASMYLHALLLCGGTSLQGYSISKPDPKQMDEIEAIDISQFVSEIFSRGYAEFLLRFGTEDILDVLKD